jgi:hypothetical protein
MHAVFNAHLTLYLFAVIKFGEEPILWRLLCKLNFLSLGVITNTDPDVLREDAFRASQVGGYIMRIKACLL